MASATYQYLVKGPIAPVDAGQLQSYLNGLGAEGWELVDAEVKANFLVFQQTTLPAGCAALFTLVLNAVLNGLGKGR